MRTHVDWITGTMGMEYGIDTPDMYAQAIERTFISTFGTELVSKAFGGKWETKEFSRAPYTDAWTQEDGEITLFASPHLNHCCLEISGKGCETLISKNLLEQVIGCLVERLTRLDIASDIETELNPKDFVAKTRHVRMRSSGHQLSASGETCYVGSRESERYARVYRYFSPHPRANLLRVEHVFRRDYARSVGRAIVNAGVDCIAYEAGKAFGWAHEEWQPELVTPVDISVVAAEKTSGSTVFWLIKQVAPAFQRLVDDGTIRDPEEFLRKYFLSNDTYA